MAMATATKKWTLEELPDTVAADVLVWSPSGASESLTVDVQGLFA